jgi:hypothetical protein
MEQGVNLTRVCGELDEKISALESSVIHPYPAPQKQLDRIERIQREQPLAQRNRHLLLAAQR